MSSKQVLLVDDQEKYLDALRSHLTDDGPNVVFMTAENGEKGLAILETLRIDLIVTDLHMPVMNGFKFVSEVKQKHPNVPIIVMSTHFSSETEKLLSEMGVLDFISKFNVDLLREKIRQTLLR